MQIKQLAEFLDVLQQGAHRVDVLQDAIGAIAQKEKIVQVTATFFEENGRNCHYTFFQKYDTMVLNGPDYQEELPFNADQGLITFRYWKEDGGSRCSESEVDVMRVMSRIMGMYLAQYRRLLREKNAVTYDADSGAFNANGYLREGQKILDSGDGSLYAVLYLNVSKFKLINQMYGHSAGNVVLSSVARKLNEFLISLGSGQMAGRLGGDNFVALIKGTELQKVLSYLNDFEVELVYEGTEIYLRLNFFIGIYMVQPEDHDMSVVMENASLAYSMARFSGRCEPVYYNEDLHKQIIREKEIEGKMREALENKEFEVYYQPKIDLATYQLNGAEALVRWIEGDRVIAPMEFIPLFERNGFICNIDFYVLNRVCRSMRRWLDQGIDMVPISVNFSKVHFNNSRFTEQIVEVIRKYRVPAKYIEIEFTETVDFQDKESLVRAVEYLKNHGIATSMDDFGTGFSSLSLLKTLPVDVLKIDKSLLDTQTSSVKERVIISNVVRMVKEMDIQVITEGVETREQAEFLREINCENAQGFLFDKPLPKNEFEKRLLKGFYEGNELKDV